MTDVYDFDTHYLGFIPQKVTPSGERLKVVLLPPLTSGREPMSTAYVEVVEFVRVVISGKVIHIVPLANGATQLHRVRGFVPSDYWLKQFRRGKACPSSQRKPSG